MNTVSNVNRGWKFGDRDAITRYDEQITLYCDADVKEGFTGRCLMPLVNI